MRLDEVDTTGGYVEEEGEFTCTITGSEIKQINDKRAVEFKLVDDCERMVKTKAFFLTDKALVFLARFAQACQLSDAEMAAIETEDGGTFRKFYSRQVLATVTARQGRDKTFYEATKFRKAEGTPAKAASAPQAPAPAWASQPQGNVSVSTEGTEGTEDDLPF
jgi:hypothetical protein